MALFRKAASGPTVGGRARVVPDSTANVGENFNNLSRNGRAKTVVYMRLVSCDDGGPAPDDGQRVTASLSNWLRIIMASAGSNYGPHELLPDEILLSVTIEAATRRIVDVDWDAAEREYDEYHDVGVEYWKRTEAPLSSVRSAVTLPGKAVHEGKSLLRSWKEGFADLKADMKPATPTDPGAPHVWGKPGWSDEEFAQALRGAATRRLALERNPKMFDACRTSAMTALPMQASMVAGGTMNPIDFEHAVAYEEASGTISVDEARQFRQQAGLDAATPE